MDDEDDDDDENDEEGLPLPGVMLIPGLPVVALGYGPVARRLAG